jgi:hypothetical protein
MFRQLQATELRPLLLSPSDPHSWILSIRGHPLTPGYSPSGATPSLLDTLPRTLTPGYSPSGATPSLLDTLHQGLPLHSWIFSIRGYPLTPGYLPSKLPSHSWISSFKHYPLTRGYPHSRATLYIWIPSYMGQPLASPSLGYPPTGLHLHPSVLGILLQRLSRLLNTILQALPYYSWIPSYWGYFLTP